MVYIHSVACCGIQKAPHLTTPASSWTLLWFSHACRAWQNDIDWLTIIVYSECRNLTLDLLVSVSLHLLYHSGAQLFSGLEREKSLKWRSLWQVRDCRFVGELLLLRIIRRSKPVAVNPTLLCTCFGRGCTMLHPTGPVLIPFSFTHQVL
jgi:hypothetical protein